MKHSQHAEQRRRDLLEKTVRAVAILGAWPEDVIRAAVAEALEQPLASTDLNYLLSRLSWCLPPPPREALRLVHAAGASTDARGRLRVGGRP